MLVPKSWQHPVSSDDEDLSLVLRWIDSYAATNTRQIAEREARRFILWLGDAGVRLLDVDESVVANFRNFLVKPKPERKWIGPKTKDIESASWRPFAGPLGETSISTSLNYLSSLYSFLVAEDRIGKNPVNRKKLALLKASSMSVSSRSLSPGARGIITEYLDTQPVTEKSSRNRLIFMIGFYTGARRSELAKARFSDFRLDSKNQLWFHVIGKGNKEGRIPVPDRLRVAIEQRKISILNQHPGVSAAGCPVLCDLRTPTRAIGAHQVWKSYVDCVSEIARYATEHGYDTHLVSEISESTTHWLRHSYAVHLLTEVGADIKVVSDNLRHASMATTSVYLNGDEDQRFLISKSAEF